MIGWKAQASRRDITMFARIAITVALVLSIVACGSALEDLANDDSGQSTTVAPDPTPTTLADDTTTDTTVDDSDDADDPATTTTTLVDDAGDDTHDGDEVPEPPEQLGDTQVLVYLFGGPDSDPENYDCAGVFPTTRLVQSPMVLSGAIEALVAGPTADERAAGYDSWFSDEIGWKVDSVTITDGIAHIDFTEDSPFIPNASTSCGSMGLMAQLDMTATQFSSVDRAIYSIGGDVAAFYHWLERDVPQF